MSSIAGGYTGSRYNKINVLKKLGFKFYEGKKIRVIMIKGAAVNIECILSKEITLGDHTIFVGEVIEASNNAESTISIPRRKIFHPEHKCSKTDSGRA
jgi:flavin reductase (DIM6/NTAB) family NADH-FMN oxidoreductase RutF